MDEENIPSKNNYMKESKDNNKKELIESEVNMNNRSDKKKLANNNTIIPNKENKVLNNKPIQYQ